MKQVFLFLLVAAVLAWLGFTFLRPGMVAEQATREPAGAPAVVQQTLPDDAAEPADAAPGRAVFDISVHTVEGLQVLLDRAEELAMRPQVPGEENSVVLVLHGPEVEFFSIKNYEQYRDLVDQAARLDAFDVVDVKICQTMMGLHGVERDDIPAFIEQVPLGSLEIERLVGEGYVAF